MEQDTLLYNISRDLSIVQSVSAAVSNSVTNITGCDGTLRAAFISQVVYKLKGGRHGGSAVYCITADETASQLLKNDLVTIAPNIKAVILQGFGTLPYHASSKGNSIFSTRAATLTQMAIQGDEKLLGTRSNQKEESVYCPMIFIIPIRSALQKLPSVEYIKSLAITIKTGDVLSSNITQKLQKIGYYRVPRVTGVSEYAVRGEVLDVASSLGAYRILTDFDTVTQIRTLDTVSQRTLEPTESIIIPPAKEVIFNDESLNKVLDAAGGANCDILQNLIDAGSAAGEELLYPVINKSSLVEYIGTGLVFFLSYERLSNAATSLKREYNEIYQNIKDAQWLPAPQTSLCEFDILINNTRQVRFCDLSVPKLNIDATDITTRAAGDYTTENKEVMLNATGVNKTDEETYFFKGNGLTQQGNKLSIQEEQGYTKENNECNVHIESNPANSYLSNMTLLKEDLTKKLSDGYKIFVFANNDAQAVRVKALLKSVINDDEGNPNGEIKVLGEQISAGFTLNGSKIKVIAENEIFGRQAAAVARIKKTGGLDVQSKALDSVLELSAGDYVVHIQYGIGMFAGIEHIKTSTAERDYIKLEYAGGEYLFVPIEQVNMVSRYIGGGGKKPPLDKIGSSAWAQKKAKAQKAAEELAARLITLYAKREVAQGFCCKHDDEFDILFEAQFPYEDTPDQATATREIKNDMESNKPMDRLLVGDVGFGKTEVAMRACFKAVGNGRQAAVLCPTTVLCEQHFDTFTRRFKSFPIKIEKLSRFVDTKDTKKVLSGLIDGSVDIVIGTQRILQKDVKFKQLGLLVIDEEQRFGVKDKERLKEMTVNVDVLTLTATPIPRTLQQGLLKIRDMSVLRTPPQNRKPIETVIAQYSDTCVKDAIEKEITRQGQVYYLHNRIETLAQTKRNLETLCPEVLVETVHGKMTPQEIDEIFTRFRAGGFNVLISTSIIENGVDIPRVNTIIIDRADLFGVSQLYQLRGRVGRSDKKAFAYLLYGASRGGENKEIALSEIAMKRLSAIGDNTALGAGFNIAVKDMEIRGAGNLLGREQAGNIYAIGGDLYMKMIKKKIEEVSSGNKITNKSGDLLESEEVKIEATGAAYISDKYVSDVSEKVEIYKIINDRCAILSQPREKLTQMDSQQTLVKDTKAANLESNKLDSKHVAANKGRSTQRVRDNLFAIQNIKVSAATVKERLIAELKDRYGPPPKEVSALIDIACVAAICKRLGVKKIASIGDPAQCNMIITWGEMGLQSVSIDKILKLIKEGNRIKISAKYKNSILVDTKGVDKTKYILEILENI